MSELWVSLVAASGTLAGALLGFASSALTQRWSDERLRRRGIEADDRRRALQLEDERHDFQLKTLLKLQEQVRRMARSTLLIIDHDKRSFAEVGEPRLIDEDVNAEAFAARIAFTLNAARVTDDHLRDQLVEFGKLCTDLSLPPMDWRARTAGEMVASQGRRRQEFASKAEELVSVLGAHLRQEIDRSGSRDGGAGLERGAGTP